ncbi:hypothetical protein ACN9JF_16165 (plasmid) [Pseudoalteromonas lipolytica]|uniref:hypothetical protein n=1 Tax=Pseudoalteromonas lipolytica TaxID=570156 RepID=UPI003BA09BE2
MKLYATILLLCIYAVPVNSEPLHVKIMTDFIPQADGSPENEATEFVLAAATELGNKSAYSLYLAANYRTGNNLVNFPMSVYSTSLKHLNEKRVLFLLAIL